MSASNLFSTGGKPDDSAEQTASTSSSKSGKKAEIREEDGNAKAGASGAQIRSVSKTRVLGRVPGNRDKRKWGNLDYSRGVLNAKGVAVTRDDRMSAVEAGEKFQALLVMFGLDKANEGEIVAFARGMWICHAVNSGSVLQPGRATVSVGGTDFPFSEVVRKLGVDQRRFFRAFADEIAEELKRQLDVYDFSDPVSCEIVSWIESIAVARGLQRYPWLIHDSASAGTSLSMVERAALAHSANLVLSTTINAADSMQARAGAHSADDFDSTNAERVQGVASAPRGRR